MQKTKKMDYSKTLMVFMLVVLGMVGVVALYAMNVSTENRSGAYEPTMLTESYTPNSLDMDMQLLESNVSSLEE